MMMRIETFDYQRGHVTEWHEHDGGQFYWLTSGIMVVETEQAQWTVTPGSVGWFPAGLRHRAQVPGQLSGTSLYLHASTGAGLPLTPGIYGTDSFIQALLERLCAGPRPGFPADYSPSLLSLLAAEITNAVELPLQLLLPTDRRARNVADQLLAHSDSPLTQTQLAQRWGLSVRSLSRLFREQTGLSFCQWRQQAKVVTSLQWVLAGEPIAEVAARSGYANVSAFIEVFRERFGRTPGQLQLASAKSPLAGG